MRVERREGEGGEKRILTGKTGERERERERGTGEKGERGDSLTASLSSSLSSIACRSPAGLTACRSWKNQTDGRRNRYEPFISTNWCEHYLVKLLCMFGSHGFEGTSATEMKNKSLLFSLFLSLSLTWLAR